MEVGHEELVVGFIDSLLWRCVIHSYETPDNVQRLVTVSLEYFDSRRHIFKLDVRKAFKLAISKT